MFTNVIYAADAAQPVAANGSQAGMSMFSMILMVLVYGVIIYFIFVAPNKKKQKAHQTMLAELKEGDTVITSGGIKGEIVGVTDDFFEVRIDKGVKITIKKNYIAGLYK